MTNPARTDPHPYDALSPESVIDAVESGGLHCDLRILALNSYENRVYQVGIEDGEPLIAKFYRPGRWSDAQIQEEHDFVAELANAELPVIAPLPDANGHTLRHHGGFSFALFPRQGGHAPELEDPDSLLRIGRLMGRLHAIGAARRFMARPALTIERMGDESVALIAEQFIPADLREAYTSLTEHLLQGIREAFAAVPEQHLRLHGDCHVGNVLARGEFLHLVDFDDSVNGPAIQDLWMLLSGPRDQRQAQLSELVDGYNEFHDFRPQELRLIEPLRALRQLHYAAWLARRWQDPAFPRHFPWFNTGRYWAEHILELREQLAALDEPPLALF